MRKPSMPKSEFMENLEIIVFDMCIFFQRDRQVLADDVFNQAVKHVGKTVEHMYMKCEVPIDDWVEGEQQGEEFVVLRLVRDVKNDPAITSSEKRGFYYPQLKPNSNENK